MSLKKSFSKDKTKCTVTFTVEWDPTVTTLDNTKAGENGKIFGSVTSKDIAEQLNKDICTKTNLGFPTTGIHFKEHINNVLLNRFRGYEIGSLLTRYSGRYSKYPYKIN